MKNEMQVCRNNLWSPFSLSGWGPGMGRLERELGRFFDGAGLFETAWPALNLRKTETGLEAALEVPGFEPEQLEVQVENGHLVVRGNRQEEKEETEAEVLVRECRTGSFERSVKLPWKADPEGIRARYHQGILRVEVPRAVEDQPRRIQITAGE